MTKTRTVSRSTVTRHRDRSLAVALWNLVDPDHVGAPRIVRLAFRGIPPTASVRLTRVDSEHGNTLAAYQKMGKPRYPTRKQIDELNRASVVVPETTKLRSGRLELQLSPNALVLVEVGR